MRISKMQLKYSTKLNSTCTLFLQKMCKNIFIAKYYFIISHIKSNTTKKLYVEFTFGVNFIYSFISATMIPTIVDLCIAARE